MYEIVKKYNSSIKYLGIEPDEEAFLDLKKNYLGIDNVILVNKLIGDGSIVNFYTFNNNYKKFDNNGSGLNSIDKASVLRQLNKEGLKNFNKYIDIKEYQTFTLKSAIEIS